MRRRFYAVWIPAEHIMTLLGNWKHQRFIGLPWLHRAADVNGNAVELPADYEVIDATYCWERKAVGIRIAHHSFPEVPEGEYAPSLYFREVTVETLRVRNPDAGEDAPGPIIVEVPTP